MGGGSSLWPFITTDTNYGVAVQSTTTPEWFKNGLMASTTSYFVSATTTGLTTTNQWFTGVTSALLGTDNNGLVVGTTVPSRERLEFEGGVISALFQQRIGVSAPMEITP